MKIYFEIGSLRALHEVDLELGDTLYVATCSCGYSNMIIDTLAALRNKRNIYTNELSLLGATELFGKRFLHELYIRNDKNKWTRVNRHLIDKLGSPIAIQEYARKYICGEGKKNV